MPMSRQIRGVAACALLAASPSVAGAADFALSLSSTGKRDYYCVVSVVLENRSTAPLTELSGYFLSYVGEEKVGRSKGAWFINMPAGSRVEATFETPNIPCEAVDRHVFTIGACRIGAGFEDPAVCADRLIGEGTIEIKAP